MSRSDHPRLVGRATQWAALESLLDAASSQRGGLVVLHGEAGIGKTALSRAFADAARVRGFGVGWGRAPETGGAPPFWPWIEVLRELRGQRAEAPIEETATAILATLMPELGAANAPPMHLGDSASARFRMADAVSQWLQSAARATPLAIVLDDLHAADVLTLETVALVAAVLPRNAIALVATHRDVEARISPPVHDALASIRRHAETLPLGRLRRAEVRELVEAHGHSSSDELVDALVRSTEGNPLFLVETLGLLRRDEGFRKLPIPHDARESLRRHLALLPEPTREVLELGAAMGRNVDLAWLCLALDASIEVVREALRPALRVDVLAEGARSTELVFTHVLLRDELYSTLPEARRLHAHHRLALALERRESIEARTRTMGLAHHYLEAAPIVGMSPAVRYVCAAADQAVELHAHHEAIELLQRAFSTLDLLGGGEDLRGELLVALGRAAIRGGETSRGKEACRRAIELARARGDSEALARAVLVWGEQFTLAVVDAELVGLLREAAVALGPTETPLRARILARLAAALQPARDHSAPIALAREAIALARRVGDVATRLEVSTSAGSALVYFAEPEERAQLDMELVEIARLCGDKVRLARGHLRLVFDALEQADLPRADVHVAAYRAVAEDLDLPAYTWTACMLDAMRATLLGSFAEAERAANRAREQAALADDPNAPPTLIFQRTGLLTTATRWSELGTVAGVFAEAITRTADLWYAQASVVGLESRLGRVAEVRRRMDFLSSELDAYHGRPSAAWLAEGCLLLGDRELAEQLVEILGPMAHRCHLWGVLAMVWEPPLSGVLGRLLSLLGRYDDAVGALDSARAACSAMKAAPHVAQLSAYLAETLVHRGAPGDDARAAELRVQARTLASELDMPGLAASLEEGPDASAPRTADSIGVDESPALALSLQLEGEYWTVSDGRREIHLKDSRGLRMLAALLDAPGRRFHVLELLGTDASRSPEHGSEGEMLDAVAIGAYRKRVQELREEIAEHEGMDDAGADALRAELDQVTRELSRGLGLGGRQRRFSSGAERARVNVRQRLVDAIGRIARELPGAGKHLRRAVRTGTFCSYEPDQ